ncbi:MAG: YebC/PmpR family DNA-binding transcriptional regulator, partial [Clostridia bacterium]
MSGHSKWNNIKNKKAKGDAVRSKIFTKIGRELAVAVKAGGADINANSKLFDIVQKAKANNMPNDNISRSIKKASGELGSINYENMTYEGYGTAGSALIVECLTDNKNRTAGDVRCAFEKFGGSLGTSNCVSFMFDRKATIVFDNDGKIDEDIGFELALECGADDVQVSEDIVEFFTTPQSMSSVRDEVVNKGYNLISAEIVWIPQTNITLDEESVVKFQKMLDMLEDSDDVQNVFHNVA